MTPRRQAAFMLVFLLLAGVAVGYAVIPQNTIQHNHGITFPTINGTLGYWVGVNQIVSAGRAATFTTVNTGHGANELYPMNQGVRTTDSVVFDRVNVVTDYMLNGTIVTDVLEYPVSSASYIIWTDGTNYYAKNGTTGEVEFDGNDPAAVLGSAVHATAPGGEILIKAGLYEGRFYIDRDNITVSGEGMYATILRLPDGTNIEAQTLTIAADYVTVKNLQVDGNRGGQVLGVNWGHADGIAGYGDYITIESVFVRDAIAHGIIFWAPATGVYSNAARGARAHVSYNSVLFCRIENSGSSAYVGHSIDSAFSTRYFKIMGNTVIGDGTYSAGVGGHGFKHCIISNNYVENCVTGIGVNGEYSTGYDVEVSNNVVNHAGTVTRGSIEVCNGAKRVTVSNNVIYNNSTKSGIAIVGAAAHRLSDIVVEGNTVYGFDTTSDGIEVGYADHVNLCGNTITNAYNGIEAVTAMVNLNINGNVIKSCYRGMYLVAPSGQLIDRAQINGNTIDTVTTNGIYTTRLKTANINNNLLYGISGESGIDVRNSNYVTVSGNTLRNLQQHGILIGSGTSQALVEGNIVNNWNQASSVRAAIYVLGTTEIGVYDNHIYGGVVAGTRGIHISATPTLVKVKNNYATCHTPYLFDAMANVYVEGNTNYIAPSEIRTASGTLTAGNVNAICFAWNNPEAQDILIRKVVVEVTTAGGTAGSHLDVGIADDATGTNRGIEFFNDLDLNAIAIRDSWVAGDGGTQTKWVFCQDTVSAVDDWVVGQILDANAALLVGRYYIEYTGR